MRSGARTYNAAEDEFMGKALNKVLSDMSYSQLRAYEYNLWLAAVKDYGSEEKLREAFSKKGIKLVKPPPPVQMAGFGGGYGGAFSGPMPELPPLIVPTQTANVQPSPEERRATEEQVNRLRTDLTRRNNISPPPIPTLVNIGDYAAGDRNILRGGDGSSSSSSSSSAPPPPRQTSAPPRTRPTDEERERNREIYRQKTQSMPRGTKVYATTLRRVIEKLFTDKRDQILRRNVSSDAASKALRRGWRGNITIRHIIEQILKDAGIDPTGTGSTPTQTNENVQQIYNAINDMPVREQQEIMNRIARAMIEDGNFRDNGRPIFNTRDMTEEKSPEINEPDPVAQVKISGDILNELKKVMSSEQAARVFSIITKQMSITRLKKYKETGDFAYSDVKTNEELMKAILNEVMRAQGLNVNPRLVARILKDAIPIMKGIDIPESLYNFLPTTIQRDSGSNLNEEERKEYREVTQLIERASGSNNPRNVGTFMGYRLRISSSLYDTLMAANGGRPLAPWLVRAPDPNVVTRREFGRSGRGGGDPDDDDDDDDPDDPRRGGGDPSDDPDPPNDPDPPDGDGATIIDMQGNRIIVMSKATFYAAIGYLAKKGYNYLIGDQVDQPDETDQTDQPDQPDQSGDVKPISSDTRTTDTPSFDNIVDASTRQFGPDTYINRSPTENKPVSGAPPIDEKIKVAETDLDNLTFRLNQARYYNASPEQIANLEDQVAKQKEILYIAMSSKYGTPSTIDPYDTDDISFSDGSDSSSNTRTPESSPEETKDDEGTVVPNLEPDKTKQTDTNAAKLKLPTHTSEGTLIAEYINPSEAKLFLSSDQESRDEQKRFEEFSRVEPGNSLGNAGTNPLIRVNNEYYRKQFQNADKTMEKRRPYIVPTIAGIRRRTWSDPQFIDRLDGYEYGKVRFEEDSYHTNRFMSNTLYNPMLVTDEWREYERAGNYHPELKLAGYRFRPTTIPELRNIAGYKGVDSRPSINNNINIASRQTGYEFSEMRRDDNFTGKPQKVRTQLSGFTQPVRMTSTRGGR